MCCHSGLLSGLTDGLIDKETRVHVALEALVIAAFSIDNSVALTQIRGSCEFDDAIDFSLPRLVHWSILAVASVGQDNLTDSRRLCQT